MREVSRLKDRHCRVIVIFATILPLQPKFTTAQGLTGAGPVAMSSAAIAPAAVPGGKPANTCLPSGTVVYLRLASGVSTKASHLHQPISARAIREVATAEGVAIPLGAVASGRVEKIFPSSSPTDRARLLMRFTQLEIPGRAPVAMTGHVAEVGNAREQVLPDGTIQGVLASELPLTHLEGTLAKLGQVSPEIAAEIEKQKEKSLGQSDTSIDFPAGADLRVILDKPLPIQQVFPPAVPDQLSQDLVAAIDHLMADAPQRSSSKDGKPGDPLNLVMVGTAERIRQVYEQAGWSLAEQKSSKSILGTIRAVMGDQGYGTAPVSDLYLYGRPEDFAFEKMLNTFAKRHHLRLWRAPVQAPDGREIWLGAATHDVGIDVHPGVASHAIDPDLDDERAKVGADLLVTGLVAAQTLVTRPNPVTSGFTATGGTWKTDGRLLVVGLK